MSSYLTIYIKTKENKYVSILSKSRSSYLYDLFRNVVSPVYAYEPVYDKEHNYVRDEKNQIVYNKKYTEISENDIIDLLNESTKDLQSIEKSLEESKQDKDLVKSLKQYLTNNPENAEKTQELLNLLDNVYYDDELKEDLEDTKNAQEILHTLQEIMIDNNLVCNID